MTREPLADAGELLASIDAAGEAGDRLDGLAEQLETLATAERGPDHGRLARIQNALSEVKAEVDDDAAATIDEAVERILDYRETVQGV